MIELQLQLFGGRGGGSGGSGSDRWHGGDLKKSLRNVEDRIRKDRVESLIVLDEKGNILIDLSDNRESEVVFTREAFMLAANNILTHNHPMGSMFSPEDVGTFINTNAKELRVATPDGRAFALRRIGDTHARVFAAAYKRIFYSTGREAGAKYWDPNKSDEENSRKIHPIHTRMITKWMRENAKNYGYEFREERKRK